MSRESRIANLNAIAEERKQNCLDRTQKAINQLLKNNERISFGSIARVAGVSTSYLYKYPEIKERVQDLREQQKRGAKKPTVPQTASEKSKAVIINQLRERIKRLENEKNELRQANERLTGKLYQYFGIEEQVERFRAENTKLKQQLEKCHSREEEPQPADSPKVSSLEKKRKRKNG